MAELSSDVLTESATEDTDVDVDGEATHAWIEQQVTVTITILMTITPGIFMIHARAKIPNNPY